jgi:hypothetical protein
MTTPPCSTAPESHGLHREGVSITPCMGAALGRGLAASVCCWWVEEREVGSGSRRLVFEGLMSQCQSPPSWEHVNRLFGCDRSNLTSQTVVCVCVCVCGGGCHGEYRIFATHHRDENNQAPNQPTDHVLSNHWGVV